MPGPRRLVAPLPVSQTPWEPAADSVPTVLLGGLSGPGEIVSLTPLSGATQPPIPRPAASSKVTSISFSSRHRPTHRQGHLPPCDHRSDFAQPLPPAPSLLHARASSPASARSFQKVSRFSWSQSSPLSQTRDFTDSHPRCSTVSPPPTLSCSLTLPSIATTPRSALPRPRRAGRRGHPRSPSS